MRKDPGSWAATPFLHLRSTTTGGVGDVLLEEGVHPVPQRRQKLGGPARQPIKEEVSDVSPLHLLIELLGIDDSRREWSSRNRGPLWGLGLCDCEGAGLHLFKRLR